MDHIEVVEKHKRNWELDLPRMERVQITLEILEYLTHADPQTQQEFHELQQVLNEELKESRRGPQKSRSTGASASPATPASFAARQSQATLESRDTDLSEAQFSFPSHGSGPSGKNILAPNASGDFSHQVRVHIRVFPSTVQCTLL